MAPNYFILDSHFEEILNSFPPYIVLLFQRLKVPPGNDVSVVGNHLVETDGGGFLIISSFPKTHQTII